MDTLQESHQSRVAGIQPAAGREGFQRAYEHSYHDGARNQVHTGPAFPSQLVVPVMPAAG